MHFSSWVMDAYIPVLEWVVCVKGERGIGKSEGTGMRSLDARICSEKLVEIAESLC